MFSSNLFVGDNGMQKPAVVAEWTKQHVLFCLIMSHPRQTQVRIPLGACTWYLNGPAIYVTELVRNLSPIHS